MNKIGFIYFAVLTLMISCYSFKGISIPENLETFNLPYVEVRTPDAPVGINLEFHDKLMRKITQESRLTFNKSKPDITIKSAITRYFVESISPTANNVSDANRLVIEVTVEYEDSTDTKNNWRQKFNNNREFASSVDLFSVQDQLIDEIYDNIVEDIFNKAFTNW